MCPTFGCVELLEEYDYGPCHQPCVPSPGCAFSDDMFQSIPNQKFVFFFTFEYVQVQKDYAPCQFPWLTFPLIKCSYVVHYQE